MQARDQSQTIRKLSWFGVDIGYHFT